MCSSNNQRTPQEILDSDDELSIEYSEDEYEPAYQDDLRFEYLEELRNKSKLLTPTKEINEQNTEKNCEKANLYKAIFNKKDAYCFWSIQEVPKDTLLWFFKFLVDKDRQSNYKFLKSCLVPKYEDCMSKSVYNSINLESKTDDAKYRLKVVIN